MPIRYQCDTCGSTLTIKEELAGSPGKCPKCKTAFVVPELSGEDSDTRQVAAAREATVKEPPSEPLKANKGSIGRSKSRRKNDDDFDPMAVLMGDEPGMPAGGGRRSPAPPPLSDDEVPSDFALDLELGNDDQDEPVVRKSKKRKRVQFDSDDDLDVQPPKSASATATAMLSGGGASAGAKDLLTRTMEESRARASRIDDEQPGEGGPTFRDYFNEYGLKGLGILAAIVIVSWGLYQISDMATGGGLPLPELGRVTGVVTLDGQPLEGADVTFAPLDRDQTIGDNERQKLRASTATTDAEGEYDLNYTEDVRGAAVTEHRVIIKKLGPNGRLLTPVDYFDNSMNTRTVEPGSNEFNFELQSDAVGKAAPRGR